MIPAFVKVTAKRVLFLLGGYFLCRILFLLWNWELFRDVPSVEVVRAFLFGIRFDLAAIFLTNSPILFLAMLPLAWFGRPWLRYVEVFLFALFNMVALGLNVVDAEFVKFIGKRSSYDLLLIREDIQRHALSVLGTYWYFCIAVFALLVLLMWITPRYPRADQPRSPLEHGIWRLALMGFAVILVRGGFQFKPLHPMDAYFSTHQPVGLLTLNTPFTLIRSKSHGRVAVTNYLPSDQEAILHLKKLTDLSRPPLAIARNFNVVILILESFGSEYTGVANDYKGYTPFFDELTKAPGAVYFRQNFANARRSIEGLPAVLCALPGIMESPILTSDFSNNRFECLPQTLAQKGYSTYFLHGAHNGSMHFDTFARIAGFKNFVGLNEYPKENPEDLDPYWGVLDEPMFQYATKVLDSAPKPAMIGLFSLSSHHPYYIPPKYKDRFPKGPLEIHESIGYTDYSLRAFFETASKKPWFNHTIFVVTADHTQKTQYREYETLLGYYRVPLLIYVPGLAQQLKSVDRQRITQHIDIVPSVLDLLGIESPTRLLVGQSVFDAGKEGRAFNYTSAAYWYIDRFVNVELWNGNVVQAHHHDLTKQLSPMASDTPEAQQGLLNLKAALHYLNNGLIKNNLHDWRSGF